MANPQEKQPRKLQVIKAPPRQQRRNWQRENRERKTANNRRWTENQPPNDAA